MAKTRKVLTVVVAYNPYRGGFFPRCLQAIQALHLRNDAYEILHEVLVVDNVSSDDTRDRMRREFPQIELSVSAENLGYAGGNNVGIQRGLDRQADFIAIVTQDVEVDPNWLLEAIAAADTDPAIGIVQPLLMLWPDKTKINSIGNAIHIFGYGYAQGYQKALAEVGELKIADIPYPSGACLLLRADTVRDIGLFDEEMWMYNEDQDLGWRAWLRSYRSVLAPKAVAYHQYEFSRSISKIYFMDRNRLLAVLQNYHWATLVILSPFLAVNELATMAIAWRAGWAHEKWRVWRYFSRLDSWKKLGQKRRLRQSNRTLKEHDMVAKLTGRILFQDINEPIVLRVANPVLDGLWRVLTFVVRW